MPANRYDDSLREGNQIIIDLTPANYTLRIELALELKSIIQNNPKRKILEIGVGEGDLTKHILKENPAIHIDCLDISEEMIETSKQTLGAFADKISFITEDALEYLEKIDFKYDIITAARTMHNFPRPDKKKLFEKTYERLSTQGTFIMMDKVYVDKEEEREKSLKMQLERYRYLSPDLKKEITDHEILDASDEYRMDELSTIETLKTIGFKNIQIIDRVERDVILIAEK